MKILLAVDGSKFSDAGTQAIVRQMKPENAEVCVLHVLDPLLLAPEFRVSDGERLKMAQQRLRHEADDLVRRTEQLLSGTGFRVHTKIREGDHRMEIIDEAAEWGADLIVLGSHGRKGLTRLLMGSVAEFVIHHADCSVQIVRITESGRR
jgi:nucleotide-binding universal stress UspA family protein